ncbi:unnamed protein product [Hydatigera taeniaeformis]|uniref:Uncharacterized protein n=1 Tax=Hydatigena taeniaeformis TaxID=6205 RepID=A0A0R3WQ74_HYDTA|nr:unnamed protein product [Hydatigera taeniaeformis]
MLYGKKANISHQHQHHMPFSIPSPSSSSPPLRSSSFAHLPNTSHDFHMLLPLLISHHIHTATAHLLLTSSKLPSMHPQFGETDSTHHVFLLLLLLDNHLSLRLNHAIAAGHTSHEATAFTVVTGDGDSDRSGGGGGGCGANATFE